MNNTTIYQPNAVFNTLKTYWIHLTDNELEIVDRNYKQWTQTNRCDEWNLIKAIADTLITRLNKKCSAHSEESTFKSYTNSGYQYSLR